MHDFKSQIDALVNATHGDPFSLLGRHAEVIRVLAPGARSVNILKSDKSLFSSAEIVNGEVFGPILFEAASPGREDYLLEIDWGGTTQITEDPYSFPPLLSDYDIFLLGQGTHHDIGACLGAIPMVVNDVSGVRFAVWAPNARRVSVVGNFNTWNGRRHPMRKREGGIWELFIPGLSTGESYKYEILGPNGIVPLKSDPIARQVETPPRTASIIADQGPKIPRLQARSLNGPLSIYELHAPSWIRHFDGRSYSWKELADRLIPYVTDLGFTHIELLPIMGHPFGGSWGYQPLSQFAPMPELGTPQDFANFVAACHASGLGVILDWVPAHFPTDTHGMAEFDGTKLYEHADPREGFHQDWNTLIFNLGRYEVREYLISSALFWLEQYGADGLRVDAVASMLYRDYSRKAGEWVPNQYGGRENLEAISFLQELSKVINQRCPGALLIAEESTAWPGVTRNPSENGLGFTHKWNMGWMHDTLHYMQEEPINRQYHHSLMSFGLVYAFSEKFVLPISHDEVVHGKRSLIGRMPGDEWQRFANLRAYLTFMWAHPGKKLLFMGCEFAQPTEWNHDAQLPWQLLEEDNHRGVQGTVRELNRLLKHEPALYERDFDPAGFSWVIGDDRDQSIFAFLRFGEDNTCPVLVISNFTPVPRYNYRIGAPGKSWVEVFNSDASGFGGSGVGNSGVITNTSDAAHGYDQSIVVTLPPLATIILRRSA